MQAVFAFAQQRTDPIIVKIIEPPSGISGLSDVLLGALGLTGVIVLAALVLGVICAGLIYVIHSRQTSEQPPPPLTPAARPPRPATGTTDISEPR